MASLINSRVAKNVKNARLMRNLSQEFIARELHISQNTYSRNELGKNPIRIDRLLTIAELLNVPAAELMKI